MNNQGLRLAALTLLFVAAGAAQQATGTINGTVVDQQAAVIPGADITIRSISTNAEFATSTNESGFYTAPVGGRAPVR